MKVERELSALETSFIASQPNINIAVIEVSGKIDVETMSKSVTLLMQRYPSFRKNTSSNNAPFHWIEINKPPTFRVVESDSWKLVAEEELRNHFKLGTQTHLWRATLVKLTKNPQSHVLLFMYEHGIADGMSKVILVNTLLNYYTLLTKGEHLVVNSLPAHQSVLEYQRLNSSRVIRQEDVDLLIQEVTEQNKSWKSSLLSGLSAQSTPNNETNGFLCVDGNSYKLKQMITTARKYQTTVGLILLTSAVWAMAKLDRLHRKKEAKKKFCVDINMDINERMRVVPALGNEHIQLFISMIPLKLKVDDRDSFWQSAFKIGKQVHKKISISHNYQMVLEHQEKVGEPYWKADANFSSMGRNPFSSQYDNIEVKKMHHIGSKWSPFFGRFVFLSQSVSSIGYDLVYEQSDHENAKQIMSMWSSLTEMSGDLNEEYTFAEFLNMKVDPI